MVGPRRGVAPDRRPRLRASPSRPALPVNKTARSPVTPAPSNMRPASIASQEIWLTPRRRPPLLTSVGQVRLLDGEPTVLDQTLRQGDDLDVLGLRDAPKEAECGLGGQV